MREYKTIEESTIIHYLQNNISEEEMKQLMLWLNENDENKELFFDLKNIDAIGRENIIAEEYEDCNWNKIKDKFLKSKKKYWITFVKYASVAILAGIITLGMHSFLKSDPVENVLTTDSNSNFSSSILLSDGSRVTLNKNTTLRYSDISNTKERIVYLDGEATFKISKNEKKPFIVYTKKQRIEVLGTTFNVCDYSGDDFAITALITGKVKIQSKNRTGVYGEEVILKPNQQIFIDSKNLKNTVYTMKMDKYKKWAIKTFNFNDASLIQILHRLERIYDVPIKLNNSDISEIKFSGTFSDNQSIEKILEVVNYEKLYSFKKVNDTIIIN